MERIKEMKYSITVKFTSQHQLVFKHLLEQMRLCGWGCGIEQVKKPVRKVCRWTRWNSLSIYYDTTCGRNGVSEVNYKFCPYCGKRIEKKGV